MLLNLKPTKSESAKSIQKLVNEVTDSVDSLKTLKVEVEHWNCILVPLVVRCLDRVSYRDWEQKIASSKEPATFDEMMNFLKERFRL